MRWLRAIALGCVVGVFGFGLGVVLDAVTGNRTAFLGATTIDGYATNTATATNTVTCTLPEAAPVGHTLVLAAGTSASNANAPAVPAGWAQVVEQHGSSRPTAAIWSRVSTGGETAVAATFSGSGVVACELYDLGDSIIAATECTQANTGAPLNASVTCTPTSAASFIVGHGSLASNTTVSLTGSSSFLRMAEATACQCWGFIEPYATASQSIAAASTATAGYVTASFIPNNSAPTTTTAPPVTIFVPVGDVEIDASEITDQFCDGVLDVTTTTAGPSTTTIAPGTCDVEISGFSADGLAVPVALGLIVFAAFVALALGWRYRRA